MWRVSNLPGDCKLIHLFVLLRKEEALVSALDLDRSMPAITLAHIILLLHLWLHAVREGCATRCAMSRRREERIHGSQILPRRRDGKRNNPVQGSR